ncbi:MAG: hypothetical protein RMY64_34170 [Nostoc sp. DedQUE08]|nr:MULTISPECIES: hypothetical protein [unclassified Nostoc]MDZ8070600.1 hypothetical protein [Nostoc sp. DedQUE08]MDZ8092721.1 hypothetical protein [Nostoc sp. DedQUE05]
MKSISGKQLCKIAEQKGWVLQRITGSHHIDENPKVEKILGSIHFWKIYKFWENITTDKTVCLNNYEAG